MTKEQIIKWTQWGASLLLGIILSSGAWILRQDKAASMNITRLESKVEALEQKQIENSTQIGLLEDKYVELLKLTASIDAKVDILISRGEVK